MIVNSTDVQNNFGKYLRIAAKENVIVTRNGMEMARLIPMEERPEETGQEDIVQEKSLAYQAAPKQATYNEFLELSRKEDTRYEYIDGEIYLLASPKTQHQYVVGKLFGAFYNHFQESQCTPFTAPYDIRLQRPNWDNPSVVQPDSVVICDLDDHLDENDYYIGVPSLVVEVLSASTQGKDLVKKLDLYMACGVHEYWIIDPSEKKALLYSFKDHRIQKTSLYNESETAESFLFDGLSVELATIFKD